jgi:F-type H+-transporting ATPase subunit delta
MINLVAKRYVKALMIDRDVKGIESVYNELNTIATAFNDDKFVMIIDSTEVSIDKKVELILSFNKKVSDTVKNFIKVLADNKRLDTIPSIVEGLKSELSVLNNKYDGVIYTNKKLSQKDVKKLNTQFSKKFNVSLELTQNICDYDGIKVDISGLGVEIGFSKERLKSQMIEHILKAV